MKFLIKSLVISVSVMGVLVIVVSYSLNTIIKNTINSYGSSITGTKLNVRETKFTINGNGKLLSLKIANPPGFSRINFLSVKNISTEFSIKSIFSKNIIINKVAIDGPIIRLEIDKNGNTNLESIINNIKKFPQEIKKNKDEQNNADETIKKMVLKEFLLKDATLEILIPNTNKKITLGVSPIIIKNVGTSKIGVPPEELVKIIFQRIYQQIQKENAKKISSHKKKLKDTKNKMLKLESELKKNLNNKINENIQKFF